MNNGLYLQISFYTQPILIVFGTIGALLNQILFSRTKSLRKSSCSLYLRVLSINDLLVLYIIVLTQWLSDHFDINPTMKYTWYCKVRNLATYCLYAVSPYCIVLVCIDRLFRTSKYSKLRRMSNPLMARRIIFVTIIFIFLVYCHILFYFTVINSSCSPLTTSYYRFLGHFLFVFYCILPPSLMIIFSSWTFILLRSNRTKQIRMYQLKKSVTFKRHINRCYQLVKILFLYVTTNIICTLPFSVLLLLDIYQNQSNPQLLIYIKCSVLLCNLNHCSSFYIYTIGTPFYRRELLHLIRSKINSLRM